MQEWAVAAARSACHGCRTPGHSHRPRQGPLGRAECTLRARTVSARSKFSLSEPGLIRHPPTHFGELRVRRCGYPPTHPAGAGGPHPISLNQHRPAADNQREETARPKCLKLLEQGFKALHET